MHDFHKIISSSTKHNQLWSPTFFFSGVHVKLSLIMLLNKRKMFTKKKRRLVGFQRLGVKLFSHMTMEFATILSSNYAYRTFLEDKCLLDLVANITVFSQYLCTWVVHTHARAFPGVIAAAPSSV